MVVMPELSIRRALPTEAELLTELARTAKRHWGYPEDWIAQWQQALSVTPEQLAEHPVYVAVQGTEVLGFYALEVDGATGTLEHLWVRPECMGRGVGGTLFRHAVHTAVAAGAETLLIDSDPHAEGFYRRMGTERVGEVPAPMDGIARVLPRMRLALQPGI